MLDEPDSITEREHHDIFKGVGGSDQQLIDQRKFSLQFGVSRVIGGRKYQEDEYTCINKSTGPAFFAVYDGHGTDDYSAHASNNLHKLILDSDLFKAGEYREAIIQGFAKEDQILYEKLKGRKGGSTSTVAIIVGDELWIGNVGDSRAVLAVEADNGTIVARRLTRDHKPADPEERGRILKAGGIIMSGRIIGPSSAIDTSRSFGDYDFKKPMNRAHEDFISSSPFIPSPIVLSRRVKFMVLASDGLWNAMNEQSVVDGVDELWREGADPEEIASIMTQRAVNECPEYADNITVIVVFFMWNSTMEKGNDDNQAAILISEHQSREAN
jgi:protein phosphatase 2C family protein 2/3